MRKSRGLSLLQLSKLSPILSRSHLYYLETGRVEPKLTTLYELSRILEVKPHLLLMDEDDYA